MLSPESHSSTALKMSLSATEKDEEETQKDDRSQCAADNSGCPSSISIGIDTILAIIGGATTGGINSIAGRLAGRVALLAEWVSRIEGMRDLAGTGSFVVRTGQILLGETIYTLAVW
jgi:hypothetical protein